MAPNKPISWKLSEIAFIRAASLVKLPMAAILTRFTALFPMHKEVTESSINYCITHYVNREEFNPDIWLAGFPGKKGYFLGLVDRVPVVQDDEIIRRIEYRYPSHKWPGIGRITAREAVEIAKVTYLDYASYYGKTSLSASYPHNEATTQQVLTRHREGYLPDVIRHFFKPPMEYDDVIFILTRSAPGFADTYLNNMQVVGNLVLPGSELLPGPVSSFNASQSGQMSYAH